jgi:hypothetical protein
MRSKTILGYVLAFGLMAPGLALIQKDPAFAVFPGCLNIIFIGGLLLFPIFKISIKK